jgi:hypothetical protein
MSSQLSEISTPGQTDVIELIINGNLIGRRNCDLRSGFVREAFTGP